MNRRCLRAHSFLMLTDMARDAYERRYLFFEFNDRIYRALASWDGIIFAVPTELKPTEMEMEEV